MIELCASNVLVYTQNAALSIQQCVEGLCSLSYARIFVRTKAQNKIDARIRLTFEHGSSDVW